jgi:type II secretion system protein J
VTKRQPTTTARRAFTLIELLLAAVLVAMVAVLLFAFLRTAVGAKEAAERKAEPPRTIDLAFEVIRQDLENAVPPTGILAGACSGGDYQDDRGRDGDSIVFYTTSPGAQHVSGDGGIRRIEYVVLSPDGQQGDHLLVRRVTHNLLAQQEPPTDDEVVLRGVGSFNLRYYDGSQWSDTWESSQNNNSLPSLVEVTLGLDRPATGQPGAAVITVPFVRYVTVPCAVQQQNAVNGL